MKKVLWCLVVVAGCGVDAATTGNDADEGAGTSAQAASASARRSRCRRFSSATWARCGAGGWCEAGY
jgi:hypothetical protein